MKHKVLVIGGGVAVVGVIVYFWYEKQQAAALAANATEVAQQEGLQNYYLQNGLYGGSAQQAGYQSISPQDSTAIADPNTVTNAIAQITTNTPGVTIGGGCECSPGFENASGAQGGCDCTQMPQIPPPTPATPFVGSGVGAPSYAPGTILLNGTPQDWQSGPLMGTPININQLATTASAFNPGPGVTVAGSPQ